MRLAVSGRGRGLFALRQVRRRGPRGPGPAAGRAPRDPGPDGRLLPRRQPVHAPDRLSRRPWPRPRRALVRAGVFADVVDVGGGFPSVYPGMIPPDLADYIDSIDRGFAEMMVHETTELWCEPGRALVAEASSILTKVELRKGDALYLNDGSYGSLFDAAHTKWPFPVKLVRDERRSASRGAAEALPLLRPDLRLPRPHAGPVLAAGRRPRGRLHRDRHAGRLWRGHEHPLQRLRRRRDRRSSTTRRWPRCSAWPPRHPPAARGSRKRSARSSACRVPRARPARSAGGGNNASRIRRVKGAAGRSVPVALFLWTGAQPLRRELPKMNADVQKSNRKAELLANTVEHVDITAYDARPVIDAMRKMSFTSATPRAPPTSSSMAHGGRGLLAVADAGRLDHRRRLHARLPRHGEVRDDRRGGRHRRLDRRHGFLRGAGLQALPGASPTSTTATCAPSTSTASTTPTSTRKSCRTATTRSTRSPTAWSRAPIPRASSSTRWASGWRRATPRSPAALIQTAYEEGVPIFCPAFVDSLGRLRPGQAPGGADQGQAALPDHRRGRRLPRTDRHQDRRRRHRPVHGRRRRAEELRPGHRGLRRDPRRRGRDAQIRRADHRRRRARRRLLVLDAARRPAPGARSTSPASRWCSPRPPPWCR